MDIRQKLRDISVIVIMVGCCLFFWRPATLECSRENDICKVHKVLAFNKSFKYSYAEKCDPNIYYSSYTDSKEFRKQRLRRKYMHDYDYQAKSTTSRRYYPYIKFADSVSSIYDSEKLNLADVYTPFESKIQDVCVDVINHNTFKFTGSYFPFDFFNYWYIVLIVGVGLFFASRIKTN